MLVGRGLRLCRILRGFRGSFRTQHGACGGLNGEPCDAVTHEQHPLAPSGRRHIDRQPVRPGTLRQSANRPGRSSRAPVGASSPAARQPATARSPRLLHTLTGVSSSATATLVHALSSPGAHTPECGHHDRSVVSGTFRRPKPNVVVEQLNYDVPRTLAAGVRPRGG